MDLFSTIEDPRHTPGKRHCYAREQFTSLAFSNENHKPFMSTTFAINPPPVIESANHFVDYKLGYGNKFYLSAISSLS